jgi:probable rRNA maturation factor
MDGDDRPGQPRPRTVLISDEQAHPVDAERLRRLAAHVLADRGVPPAMELSVACVDAAAMAALKRHHLGEDAPTDVLAFPMDTPGETPPGVPAVLGDIALCPEVAAAQAADRQVPPADELDVLLVHGILHLLGYDHVDRAERDAMFGLTDRLLGAYRETGP